MWEFVVLSVISRTLVKINVTLLESHREALYTFIYSFAKLSHRNKTENLIKLNEKLDEE